MLKFLDKILVIKNVFLRLYFFIYCVSRNVCTSPADTALNVLGEPAKCFPLESFGNFLAFFSTTDRLNVILINNNSNNIYYLHFFYENSQKCMAA